MTVKYGKHGKHEVRTLTACAMLTAVGIVLSAIRIPLSNVTEITLTGLPIAMSGYLFGPWAAAAVGVLIDAGGYFMHPTGAFFPGFSISCGLMGVIYGFLLYRRLYTPSGAGGLMVRVIVSHFLKTLLISLLLNCMWLSVFYGMPFGAVFLISLPKEAINFPIEVFLIWSLIRIAGRLLPEI